MMDAETPLWKAHDLSQALQDKIEQLPNVGRGMSAACGCPRVYVNLSFLAYVHVDHEFHHKPVCVSQHVS